MPSQNSGITDVNPEANLKHFFQSSKIHEVCFKTRNCDFYLFAMSASHTTNFEAKKAGLGCISTSIKSSERSSKPKFNPTFDNYGFALNANISLSIYFVAEDEKLTKKFKNKNRLNSILQFSEKECLSCASNQQNFKYSIILKNGRNSSNNGLLNKFEIDNNQQLTSEIHAKNTHNGNHNSQRLYGSYYRHMETTSSFFEITVYQYINNLVHYFSIESHYFEVFGQFQLKSHDPILNFQPSSLENMERMKSLKISSETKRQARRPASMTDIKPAEPVHHCTGHRFSQTGDHYDSAK